MRLLISPLAAALLCLASTLPGHLAAQQDPPRGDSLFLPPSDSVEITVGRIPASPSDLPQSVDVITRAELDRLVALEVTDVLKKVAGVDVIQYPGLLSGISIRGFRPQFSGVSQRTLVLLDGRPAGTTNLATLDLASAERIEIFRGPGSALYGSGAVGGVINVVTRESRGPLQSGVAFGYGAFGTYRGSAAVGGSLTDDLDVDVTAAAYGRIGDYELGAHRLLGGDSVARVAADQAILVAEHPGGIIRPFTRYSAATGSLRLGYDLGESWRVEARGETFSAGDVQDPGSLHAEGDPRALRDLRRRTAELSLRGALGRHTLLARAYASGEIEQRYSRPDRPQSIDHWIVRQHFINYWAPTRWFGGQVQDVVSLGAHALTAGVDVQSAFLKSKVFSQWEVRAPVHTPNSALHSAAVFAHGRFSALDDRLTATFGGRVDRIAWEVEEARLSTGAVVSPGSAEQSVLSPSAGVQYRSPSGVRVHATAGRAFIAPDAFAVAGYAELRRAPGSVSLTRGNPGLDPETSTSWDAGIGIQRPAIGLEADLTYFHTDVLGRVSPRTEAPDRVELTPGGDTIRTLTTYVNADEAEIRGMEFEAALDLGALRGYPFSLRPFANATRIFRAQELGPAGVAPIRNVADLTVGFGVDYDDRRRYNARLMGRYVGERTDADPVNPADLGLLRYPEFMILDATARARLGDRYRLGLLVENLLDENYYEVRGFNLPGRTLMVEIGASF